MKSVRCLYVLLLFPAVALATTTRNPVSIDINAANVSASFTHIGRFFGADEPNYAYFPQGSPLLSNLGSLGTNAYTEDENGNPIYNFTIVDRIFDAYLDNNVKPYAQIGFMPEALSTHPHPYSFNFTPSSPYNAIYTGWSYPLAAIRREVDSWYWEVWNEPNIPYWNGTVQEMYMLYDYAIDAVKRALPTARIGGFEVAGGPAGWYLGNFLNHVLNENSYATGKKGNPLDFVFFHAKGAPNFINTTDGEGYVQMGIAAQLQNIDDAFAVVASYPQVRDKPIIISECDPDGCAACITPQFGYTNGLHYPSFTAASFVRALDLSVNHGVNVQGALTWAFEYDDYPYFDGFRVLSTNEIVTPVINIHRMIGKMGGNRVEAISSGQVDLETAVSSGIRGSADVGVISSLEGGRLSVLVWHYHDDDVPLPNADVSISIKGVPWSGEGKLTHYRVDEIHSNAYSTWLEQGSPQEPSRQQYAALKKAGDLATMDGPSKIQIKRGSSHVSFKLPIQALSLIVIEKNY